MNGSRSSALERNRTKKGPYIQSEEDLRHMVNESGVWEITLRQGDFLVVPGHYYREMHFTSSPSYVWEGASFSMFSLLPLFHASIQSLPMHMKSLLRNIFGALVWGKGLERCDFFLSGRTKGGKAKDKLVQGLYKHPNLTIVPPERLAAARGYH